MVSATNIMTSDNPIFSSYVFYCTILGLKMLLMTLLTAKQRFKKNVFLSPEDTVFTRGKVRYDDPDVERVRRAHLNDLENIPVFFVISFFYMMTNPSKFIAVNLFRAFAVARIIHTIVYAVFVVPQPARGIAFFVGLGITIYMAAVTILAFFHGA